MKKVDLSHLSLVNFKNYDDLDLRFGPSLNCFVGNNGEGKTNVLDAIYYLAFCKSYFNPVDSQNIRNEEDFFVVQGGFQMENQALDIFCGIKKGQKKSFKRDKKVYEKLSEHIGLIPLVMISPSDISLILEGSDVRRKFVDSVISQFDKTYLDDLLNYQKALVQRNALLRSFAENRFFEKDSLEIWDQQLIQYGRPIFEGRKKFLEEFIPLFQSFFSEVSLGRDEVHLEYQSGLLENDFSELLSETLDKDRALKYTSSGIHKDDMIFQLSGKPLKKFGSQGQQKSFLVALKLAQFAFIREKKQTMPLLLLDDIFDKLDEDRVAQIIHIVGSPDFGQIFITDTSQARMEEILRRIGKEFNLYNVAEGKVQKT
ncbi:MAG: DNA replication/repair protein RecF [Flavobacteriales bacterium]|nr:DNA replication/repair protein RecF [Flavobacteriales bacterium]